ncbi:MAG: glycosyltransferase, partial [Bacteroidota bacterium]
ANDQVIISGWIQDIRENYSKSKILVAPMQSSIGLQNKLLEAMAMGLPCITSSLANNALQAKSGSEILIADTPEEYSEKILELLSDEKLYLQFSDAGLNFVKEKYSWENFNQRLFELLLNNVSNHV